MGSSPQCQIHLTDDGIRPLHCLIVHSSQETLITRWAANALLNGEDFSTAPLKAGDRITIGGVELELVADAESATPAKNSAALPKVQEDTALPATVAGAQLPSQEQSGDAEAPLISPRRVERKEAAVQDNTPKEVPHKWERDRLVRRLWSANYNSRGRCRQMIGSLRALRNESLSLDQQIKALRGQLHRAVEERERLAAELRQLEAQHDEQQRQSTAELDRLISELTAAYERANAAEESIAGQVLVSDQLRQEIGSLSRERDQLRQSQAEEEQNRILLSEELTDRDRTIEQLYRQLHELQESGQRSAEQSAQYAGQVKNLEQQMAAQRTEREQLAAEHAGLSQRSLELEQTLADRDRHVQVLESQVAAAALAEKSFQQRETEFSARIASLETEISRLQGERDDLIVDQSQRMSHLRELEQSLLNRDLAVSDLQAQLQEAAAAKQAVEQDIADHATRIESLETQRASLAAEQEKQLAQLQEMGETISARDRTIEQLQRQLAEARHSASQTVEQHAAEYAAKLRSLEAERDALVFDQTRLTGEVQQLGEAIAQRDCDVEQLRRQLEEARQSARQSEEQAAKYVATIEGLHAELQRKDVQREQMTALQAEFAQRRQQLEASLSERDQAREELQNQLREAAEAQQQAQEREAEQAAAVSALEHELETARGEHDKLAADQAKSSGRFQELERSLAQRDRRVEELEQEYAKVCEALQTIEQSSFEQIDAHRRLEAELAEAGKQRDELAAVQSRHDGELAKLQAALAERQQVVAELNEHLAAITQRRAEAENTATLSVEAHRLLEREVEELRARCQKVTGELTVERVQHHELQQSIAAYEERIEALTGELEAAHQARLQAERAVEEKLPAQVQLSTALAELHGQFDELQKTLDAECELRKEANQEIAKRNERIELLEVDLRSANSESKQATEKLARLFQERAAAEEQLSALRAELEASHFRLEDLAENESQWTCERAELVGELEAARQELAQLQEQLQAATEQSSDLPEQLATLEHERAALAEGLAAQQEFVARLNSEMEEVRTQATAERTQREQLESRYEQSQCELADARECLMTAEKALRDAAAPRASSPVEVPETLAPGAEESVDAASAAACDSAEPEHDDAAEEAIEHLRELSIWSDSKSEAERPAPAPAASPEGSQPSSFIDQYSHMFESEEPAGAAHPSPWETPNAAATAAPEAPVADAPSALFVEPSPDESDDAALEAYMKSLMRRVQGESPSAPSHGEPYRSATSPQTDQEQRAPAWLASPEKAPPRKAPSVEKAPVAEKEESQETIAPLDMDMLRMTSSKPPLATDIKALRELANTSARRAIAKHSKRRQMERAISKVLVCLVATAVAAFMMLSAESVQSPFFLAALVPAVVGLRWGLKFLGVLLEAVREGAWNKANAAELSLEESPLPIDGRAERKQQRRETGGWRP